MEQIALTFDAAKERADTGIKRSGDHANRVEPEWTGQALGLLIAYARNVGVPFLIEDARQWAYANGLPKPPDERSWGGPTRRAESSGRLRRCGMGLAKSSNLSNKPLWEYAGDAR